MAKPDWYTGSDQSGEIARGIEATIERMNNQTADQSDIQELSQLLDLELDINWRCFLMGLIGTIHYDLGEVEAATKVLQDSLTGYQTYVDSFDDVVNVYCQSCYTMGVLLYDEERYQEAIPYFMRCIPFAHEVFEEVYSGNVFMFLESCYNRTGQPELAVVSAEVATFFRCCDCSSLEKLMIAYHRAGRIDKATEVYHLLAGRCREYEHFDRVMEYAQSNLGETGTVN